MTGYLWRGKPDLERLNQMILNMRPVGWQNRAVGPARAGSRWGGARPKLTPFVPCGTNGAWQRHFRNGEDIDEACAEAHRAYQAAQKRERREALRAAREAGYVRRSDGE